MFKVRTGIGFDVHRLGFSPAPNTNLPLILGGVTIEHPAGMGLIGHSDADVLTHAIIDAILGAANMGDIGQQFPDTDQQYKGVSSLKLLRLVVEMVNAKFAPANSTAVNNNVANSTAVNNNVAAPPLTVISYIDAQVMAQEPKLAPHIAQIRATLADCMHLSEQDVSIKATTTEGLGFVGRKEGIAATAVCTLCVPST